MSRMLLLKVSYRVRAHQIAEFEEIFRKEIDPLIKDHELDFMGIWKTRIGEVGEFLELWGFQDMGDCDRRWKALMEDPRLQETFKKTGPMVEGERLTILEPVLLDQDETQNRFAV